MASNGQVAHLTKIADAFQRLHDERQKRLVEQRKPVKAPKRIKEGVFLTADSLEPDEWMAIISHGTHVAIEPGDIALLFKAAAAALQAK